MNDQDLDTDIDEDSDERLGRKPTIFTPIENAITLELFGMDELGIARYLGLSPHPDLVVWDYVSIYVLQARNACMDILNKRLRRNLRQLTTDECIAMMRPIAKKVATVYRAKAEREGRDYIAPPQPQKIEFWTQDTLF